MRRLITEDKVRPDGRKVDEIRPLDAVVDFLPRVHGSGLFTRGQTQALSILPWLQWVKLKSLMAWTQSTRNALCTTITSHNIL